MLHLERLVNLPVAVKTCLRKYACFRGRAPRSEFWWFYIFYLLACTVSILVVIWLAKSFSFGNAMLLLTNGTAFVLYLPSLAVGVCRLHDCGYSGNWLALYALLVYWGRFSAFAILIGFLLIPLPGDLGNLPLVICLLMVDVWFFISGDPLMTCIFIVQLLGELAMLLVCFKKGAAGPNRYGPDSLEGEPGRRARVLVFRKSGPDRPEPARRVRREGGRRPARSLSAARGWRILNSSDQF